MAKVKQKPGRKPKQAAPEGMTAERAEHINGLMVGAFLRSEGFGGDEGNMLYTELKRLSLGEMVEASRVVKAQGPQASEKPGYKSYPVTVDDRAIAAIYTALHYEAEEYSGPRTIFRHEGEVLAKYRPRIGG